MDNKILKIIHQIQEQAKCQQLNIQIDPQRKPEIWESKLGGVPYWPSDRKYPVDADGKPFVFLAQFNCALLPNTNSLPRYGLLQFFMTMEWDDGIVVFHEQINSEVTEESAKAMCGQGFDESAMRSPIRKECSVTLSLGEGLMSVVDCHCEAKYVRIAWQQYGDDLDVPADLSEAIDEIPASEYDANVRPSTGSHLLGYPYFTQWDPRTSESKFNRLLFQLGSEVFGKKWLVMWGDCGVGNFFISDEDLKAQRFDNVLFSWDCC